MLSKKLLSALTLLSLPCVQALAVACQGTWTGGGTPNNGWQVGLTGNWNMGCVPGNSTASDTASFINGSPPNPDITLNFAATLLTLTFDSTSPLYTLNTVSGGAGTITFEVPGITDTSQILVTAGNQTIDLLINLNNEADLQVTVASNSTLNFIDWGIVDLGSLVMPSTVEINGSGTTNFIANTQPTGLTQPVGPQPFGELTLSNGTVNFTNNLNLTGTCPAGCTGVLVSPPALTLSSGNMNTTNLGMITTSVLDSAGVTVDTTQGVMGMASGTIQLNGGTWTNTNNATINSGGVASESIGVLVSCGTITIGSASFITANNGQILNGIGCVQEYYNFTLNAGGVYSLTNNGPISTGAGGGGALAYTLNSAIINGGTFTMTNTATITSGVGTDFRFDPTLVVNGGYVGLFNTGTPTSILTEVIGAGIVGVGSITLNGGTIENNDLVAVPTFTNNGGIQSGTGMYINPGVVGGIAVTNAGGSTIPGSPTQSGTPGTMTILGSYTQGPGGNFTVNLQNTSTFSKLEVGVDPIAGGGGTANIAGTITVQASDGYSLANGDTFLVLKAVTALNGTFTLVNNLPPGFAPNIVYVADPGVQIVLGTNFGTTTITTFPGASLGTVVSTVNQINQFNLMNRLERLGCPKINPCPKEQKKRWWQKKQQPTCEEKKLEDCEPHPWNFYAGPLGTVGGEFHSKKKQIGFNYSGVGALAGFDYVWTKFGAGLLVAYEKIDAHVHRHWGKFHVDDLHGSLYGKYTPIPELAVRGIVGGSYDWYTIDRNVSFPSFGIKETAKGRPHGSEFDALLGLEYTFKVGDHGQLLPLAEVQYIYAAANKYKEHHAGMFDIKVHSQFIKSLRSGLGLRGNYTWDWENFSFTPEAHAIWQREFSDKDRNLVLTSAVFPEPNESLTMPGIGRNVILAGFDLVGTWYERYSLEGRYNFEWNSQFHDHFLYLGVDVRF